MNEENKILPLYELAFNDNNSLKGTNYLAHVKLPAIEEDFIRLSKEELKFHFKEQGERKIIVGAVAIPNLKIYRRKGNFEYEVFFSEKTIEQMAKAFIRNGHANNFNLEHSEKLENIFLYETWVIMVSNKDKAAALGFNYPVGTWMISVDCSRNEEYYNEFVKTGEVRGFSLEGWFDMLEAFSIISPLVEKTECNSEECHHEEFEMEVTILKSKIALAEYLERTKQSNHIEMASSYRWERWQTRDREGCPVCKDYQAIGWIAAGTLPAINAAHRNNKMGYEWKASNKSCRCSKEYTTESNLYIRGGQLVVKDRNKVFKISNR